MKIKLNQLGLTIIVAVFMAACGGGTDNPLSTPGTSNTPNAGQNDDTEKLIIDNGRGLSNNQDTEKPD